MFQRARSPEQKASRVEAILDAAAAMFDEQVIEDIAMNALAERAGLGKGSLYAYFPTKAHLFLELFQREALVWIADIEHQLGQLDDGDAETVARTLASVSLSHDRLCRLAIQLHAVLEKIATPDLQRSFKLNMLESLDRFAKALMRALPTLERQDAEQLFLQHHALIVGLWPFGHPPAELQDDDARLQVYRIDFGDVFTDSLSALLVRRTK